MLGQVQKIIDALIDLHKLTMDNGQMKWMLLTYACREEKQMVANRLLMVLFPEKFADIVLYEQSLLLVLYSS